MDDSGIRPRNEIDLGGAWRLVDANQVSFDSGADDVRFAKIYQRFRVEVNELL
jgi:hypothetical protein